MASTTPVFSGNKRIYSLISGVWLTWSLFYAWMLRSAGTPIRLAVTDSTISNLLLVVAAVLLVNLLKHYLPGRGSYVNLVGIVVAIAFLWYLISRAAVLAFNGDNIFHAGFFEYTATIRIAVSLLVLGCVTLIFVLRRTLEENEIQLRRKSDAEKLAREAELLRLRQQLQPHFLFNSLNSISALVTRDPTQARKMIEHLSDFLRSTIKRENEQMATAEEECRDLELYLSIEKLRFGHRLSAVIEITDEARQLKIPALLLQPVVENAIKYGVYDTTDKVNIKIKAEKTDHQLVVTVHNPFDPETAGLRAGTGFGLSSVERRLYLLFARTDLLKITQQDHLFITSVTIPQA